MGLSILDTQTENKGDSMKKIILYVLCALMLLSLCACGSRYGIVTGTDVTPTPGASTTTDNKYDVNNGGGVKSNGTGTTVPNGTAQQPRNHHA